MREEQEMNQNVKQTKSVSPKMGISLCNQVNRGEELKSYQIQRRFLYPFDAVQDFLPFSFHASFSPWVIVMSNRTQKRKTSSKLTLFHLSPSPSSSFHHFHGPSKQKD